MQPSLLQQRLQLLARACLYRLRPAAAHVAPPPPPPAVCAGVQPAFSSSFSPSAPLLSFPALSFQHASAPATAALPSCLSTFSSAVNFAPPALFASSPAPNSPFDFSIYLASCVEQSSPTQRTHSSCALPASSGNTVHSGKGRGLARQPGSAALPHAADPSLLNSSPVAASSPAAASPLNFQLSPAPGHLNSNVHRRLIASALKLTEDKLQEIMRRLQTGPLDHVTLDLGDHHLGDDMMREMAVPIAALKNLKILVLLSTHTPAFSLRPNLDPMRNFFRFFAP